MSHFRFSVLPVSVLAAALISVPASAMDDAQKGAYVNLGVSQLSAELDLSDLSAQGTTVNLGEQDLDIYMLTGRVGYRLNDYIAIEGEAGFGLGGDSFQQVVPVATDIGTINVDTDVDLDIKNYGGIFARGILPVSDQFDLFARAGYGFAKASADVTASAAGISASASESETTDDFAFGVGAQYNFADRHGVRLDYASFGGGDFDVISVSYALKF